MPNLAALSQQLVSSSRFRCAWASCASTAGLWSVIQTAGASQLFLDARLPYHTSATDEILRQAGGVDVPPSSYVSSEVCRALASHSFRRAVSLSPEGTPVIGVGCTASLRSTNPKKGDHRALVGLMTDSRYVEYRLTLAKGLRERHEEDDVISELVLKSLLRQQQQDGECNVQLESLTDKDVLHAHCSMHPPPLEELFRGSAKFVYFPCGSRPSVVYRDCWPGSRLGRRRVIIPGSFNPRHTAHDALAVASKRMLGSHADVCFALSMSNADKGQSDQDTVLKRVRQFTQSGLGFVDVPIVVVRDAPLFVDKANVFPDSTFVVGGDTSERLCQEKYYGFDRDAMICAFAEMKFLNAKFLVAQRSMEEHMTSLGTSAVPAVFADMFTPIPLEFCDISLSSTALRQSGRDVDSILEGRDVDVRQT